MRVAQGKYLQSSRSIKWYPDICLYISLSLSLSLSLRIAILWITTLSKWIHQYKKNPIILVYQNMKKETFMFLCLRVWKNKPICRTRFFSWKRQLLMESTTKTALKWKYVIKWRNLKTTLLQFRGSEETMKCSKKA